MTQSQTRTAGIPAVQVRGLTRTFGQVRAVDALDLTIGAGEVVALLGPNGAGKTTTIDAILGLGPNDRQRDGAVEVYGMSPREAIDRGLVAAVMQTGGLLPDLTVRDTVELVASLFVHTVPVDEALARAGITELARRRVGKCSGGEQQRLRFAMALVSDPALLILDEPTTGMDVGGRRRFWSAIHADAQAGRTVVFATHYLEEAELYADRVVLMAKGRIIADGTVAQIRASVGGRIVRATLSGATGAAAPASSDPLGSVRTALSGLDVSGLDLRGNSIVVTTRDSDAVAHVLLRDGLAHDLEIEARGLDDAFVALTGDDTDLTTGHSAQGALR